MGRAQNCQALQRAVFPVLCARVSPAASPWPLAEVAPVLHCTARVMRQQKAVSVGSAVGGSILWWQEKQFILRACF